MTGFSDAPLDDGLPYTILNYANGQSYEDHFEVVGDEVSRVDLNSLYPGSANMQRLYRSKCTFFINIVVTGEELYDPERYTTSAGYRSSETHSGEDVAIYAGGPMAHLFHTTHEQVN